MAKKANKVLLVLPPTGYTNKGYLPPIGVGIIAAVLEKENFDVKIIDSPVLEYDEETVVKEINKENADIVGVGGTTHSRFIAMRIINGIETDSLKVLGGNHFSSTAANALQNCKADIVINGEGEYSFLDIAKGKQLKEIKGITFREGDKVIQNPEAPRLELKDIPWPARHLFPMEKYDTNLEGVKNLKCLSIMTSRGCPFRCTFCDIKSFWGFAYRKREPMDVVNEIEHIINTYKIRGFDIWDDTFTIDKEHVKNICNEIIKRKLDIKFYVRTRVDTINRETLELMKKAGCTSISFGVESGSPRILKVIKKYVTLEEVDKGVKLADELGFFIKTFFLFNHPTEKFKDIAMTLKFMDHLNKYKNHFAVSNISTYIYPKTDVERYAKEIGMLPKDFSWNGPYYSRENKMFGIDEYVPAFNGIPLWQLSLFLKVYRRINRLNSFKARTPFEVNVGDLKFEKSIVDVGSDATTQQKDYDRWMSIKEQYRE